MLSAPYPIRAGPIFPHKATKYGFAAQCGLVIPHRATAAQRPYAIRPHISAQATT